VNRRFQAKLVKSKNMHIIKTILHRFQPNIAQQQRPPNALRVWSEHTHNKSKMADAVPPSSAVRPLKIEIWKIQDGGGRHLEKSKKNRHISAAVGAIASKFGMLTQFDPLNHSVSKIGPQYLHFDWFMRLMSHVHFQKHSLYRMTREPT